MALSDREEDIFSSITANLSNDPQFVKSTKTEKLTLGSARDIVIGALIVLAGIVVLMVGITTQIIPLGVVGFAGMVFGAAFAYRDNPHSTSSNTSAVPQGAKASNGFMQSLEEKWDERKRQEEAGN